MNKKLLIVADDYGVHSIIDNGIHKCIDAGVIDCTDIIVTHKSSKSRIKKLLSKYADKIEDKTLKLGLHLTLNVGAPANLFNPENPNDPKFIEFRQLISIKPQGKQDKDRVFRHPKARGIAKIALKLQNEYLEYIEKEMIAQFELFRKIVGRYPDHVSSHNGVFQATEPIYRVYSNFCKANNILMRCPTLMIFDPERQDDWDSDPKQKLFPIGQFIFIANFPPAGDLHDGAEEILDFTKNELKTEFDADVADGLWSTNYTVEHFFRNGSIGKLRKILNKIRDDQEPHSYELIVHPAYFTKMSQRKSLPAGIDRGKGVLRDRKQEMNTLIQEIRPAMNIRGIDPFEFPELPISEDDQIA